MSNIGAAQIARARLADQGADPASPPAGYHYVYTKSGGLYLKDSAGAVTGPLGAGFTDPMAARGDLIVRNASNATARLPLGATGRVLHSDGSDAAWAQLGMSELAAPSADVSLASHKLTNVTDPTGAQDAATKAYVDAAAAGLDWKLSVRAATTAAGTLATAFANGQVVDGVTLVTGDRLLIKDQATGSQNGLYTVNASGAPTRSTDADVSSEVTAGLAVFVEEGTTNADSGWVLTTNAPITLGTTALTFTQFSGAGQILAGGGLLKSGNTLSADFGSGAGKVTQGNDSRLSDARTPSAHQSSHQSVGSDALTGNLDATARVAVRKNTGGANVGARRRLNLIEGTGITLTVADDATDEEIDLTITATGGVAPAAHHATHEVSGADALSGRVPGQTFEPSGLTGATAASRYVGATASGAPASGTFAVGDFVIDQSGKVWVCTAAGTPGTWGQVGGTQTSLDASGGTLRLPDNTSALAAVDAQAAWESSRKLLRIHDGTDERQASEVGFAPFAFSLAHSSTQAYSTSITLPANGGSIAIPIAVTGHLRLESVTIRNGDTTLARSWEWRLYEQRQSGDGTLNEIAGANGSESFTAAAASNRTAAVGSPPIKLGPGLYWLVVRNTHASNAFIIVGVGAGTGTLSGNETETQTLGSALAATLDFVTGWAKSTNMAAARLNGRAFGQTSVF